jgi:hypothetical protein
MALSRGPWGRKSQQMRKWIITQNIPKYPFGRRDSSVRLTAALAKGIYKSPCIIIHNCVKEFLLQLIARRVDDPIHHPFP